MLHSFAGVVCLFIFETAEACHVGVCVSTIAYFANTMHSALVCHQECSPDEPVAFLMKQKSSPPNEPVTLRRCRGLSVELRMRNRLRPLSFLQDGHVRTSAFANERNICVRKQTAEQKATKRNLPFIASRLDPNPHCVRQRMNTAPCLSTRVTFFWGFRIFLCISFACYAHLFTPCV